MVILTGLTVSNIASAGTATLVAPELTSFAVKATASVQSVSALSGTAIGLLANYVSKSDTLATVVGSSLMAAITAPIASSLCSFSSPLIAAYNGVVAAAAYTSTVSGTKGLLSVIATESLMSGPLGWLTLGTITDSTETSNATYDCWKPVLHDSSRELSSGVILRDIMRDSRLKGIHCSDDYTISLFNIWDEQFELQYVNVPNYGLALHAQFVGQFK
ncbi:uncharacterized protein LOC128962750 [Oppia nitens]|uniref:uncharacterized protein LOC128962750 n=1 Tax=Oppia nitens TaxID=1686743 RepID=UPI0023DC5051|nr:uncharacterized protein LOC128962750 [Oppia nitens]